MIVLRKGKEEFKKGPNINEMERILKGEIMGDIRKMRYRAWDIRNKKMRNVSEIRWLSDGSVRINIADDIGDRPLLHIPNYEGNELKEFEIMKYIDFKDKKDVEIYEGDILRDGNWDIYVVWDEEHARYAYLCTEWVVTQGKMIMISREGLSKYEVIGNIYEKPELLK